MKLRSILNEVLFEMELPPGFSKDDLESVDNFLGNPEELSEGDFLGAPTREFPDDEMDSYLDRVVSNKKEDSDKYKYPFIHRSNIVDENGKLISKEHLRKLISKRPEKLMKQNSKMEKSGGDNFIFYDISLPALKGLIVDEKTGQFRIVSTCPAAGLCKTFCYAKRGGYVQWKASSLFQTRMVNYLLNDWEGFKNQLVNELESAEKKNSKKGYKVVLRWHDSGDFMSPKYLQVAYAIAKETPNILHYAYTKNVGMVSSSEKPDNFVFNFSKGAIPPEEKQINVKQHKHSQVVPRELFRDLLIKNSEGKWVYKSDHDLDKLKDNISKNYDIDKDSIITYDEMMDIPYDSKSATPKYNVIVVPGDGDTSAMRKDVLGTYLLIH